MLRALVELLLDGTGIGANLRAIGTCRLMALQMPLEPVARAGPVFELKKSSKAAGRLRCCPSLDVMGRAPSNNSSAVVMAMCGARALEHISYLEILD